MSRSDDERIADILEASEKLLEIVGCGHEFFLTESLAQLASERLIEIIGDAASFMHQVINGSMFIDHPLNRAYWTGLYIAMGFSIIWLRCWYYAGACIDG